ncbi:hypothetical protein H8N03_00470 [Ramlibacter sp. USB13]|uniref:Uncharacterized protein n=1 Tax=Ramlibacter cellulosilyticus TaxID=2764187 RepID=A0A923S9N1_9BURK|nr:hypothetical protein [Ramlibacter cellulosilyticus]MBC5781393.1 hypothetical protein [Ramlibacter cellulosilyticus]
MRPSLRFTDNTLTPPPGARYGVARPTIQPFSKQMQWTDDVTIGSGTQGANGTVKSEIWVYWVNGDLDDCHYVVIQRLRGTFSPGNMLANVASSRGFFQHGLTVTNALQDGSGGPMPNAQLVAYTPSSFRSSPEIPNAPVELSMPMTLQLPSSGHWAPQEFVAGDTGSIGLANWGIADRTQPAALVQSSYFHQIQGANAEGEPVGWDPSVSPPAQWPRWYSTLYDASDNTLMPPTLSQGALQFQVLVAWELRLDAKDRPPPGGAARASTRAPEPGPPGPPPASLPVTLQTTFQQDLAAFHNPTGCRTQFTGAGSVPVISGAHHICPVTSAYPPFVWKGNLAEVIFPLPAGLAGDLTR